MANLAQSVERKAFSVAIDAALKHLNKDREKGLLQIVDLAEKFMGDNFRKEAYDGARKMIQDPDNKWMHYVNRLLDETDPHVAKMTALNLGYQAAFVGTKTIRKMREVHNCNIPWLILMDPTSACNLRCTGCWAAEYGHKLNLTFDELDNIVTQGKELGIYFYMMTGGEPLVRKDDIINRAGHNIDPRRIEQVVCKVPGIKDCLAFGIPDPKKNTIIICLIIEEEKMHPDRQLLWETCRKMLAPYENPQVILKCRDLPKTSGGKVSRKMAVAQYIKKTTNQEWRCFDE